MESVKIQVGVVVEEGHEEEVLPGFRFNPTDEELVGFYLRRKVDRRPFQFDIIKQLDIYKYEPWDLPRFSSVGLVEKEWYFFCQRGRKYRNSKRPNRVTGGGFWKATGIDKQIYSGSMGRCVGLKKSLVFYRGSAGRGLKTDWMMHEFRLPPTVEERRSYDGDDEIDDGEAEAWTLCRIFKRAVTYRKQLKSTENHQQQQQQQWQMPNSIPTTSCNAECTGTASTVQQTGPTPSSSFSKCWNSIEMWECDWNWEDIGRMLESAVDPPIAITSAALHH